VKLSGKRTLYPGNSEKPAIYYSRTPLGQTFWNSYPDANLSGKLQRHTHDKCVSAV
jgi:hypothetical protein